MDNLAQFSAARQESVGLAGIDLHESISEAVREAALKAKDEIPVLYRKALAMRRFAGGWCEDPEFSEAEYAAYENWVSDENPAIPGGCRQKFLLIGANKLWELHDQLVNRVRDITARSLRDLFPRQHHDDLERIFYEVKLLNAATISIEDGPGIHSQKEIYDGSGYTREDKILHVRDEGKDFRIRAVSAYKFSGGLNGVSIHDNPGAQRDLLDYYRKFDAAIRSGTPLCYKVDVLFSIEGLARANRERSNAVIAAIFS